MVLDCIGVDMQMKGGGKKEISKGGGGLLCSHSNSCNFQIWRFLYDFFSGTVAGELRVPFHFHRCFSSSCGSCCFRFRHCFCFLLALLRGRLGKFKRKDKNRMSDEIGGVGFVELGRES